ncbi:MAG: ice-binding family protein [Candidatus Marinimicrobia bacterium]|nr:ice-binding family protein [Candidatus Neomarinimicrobiota bacterium]
MKFTRKLTLLWVLSLFLIIGIAGCDNGDSPTTPNGDTYFATATSNPVAGGSTDGVGGYDADASVTLTATPNAGFTFTNWTGASGILSTSSSYSFTINADLAVVANFHAVSTIVQDPVPLASTSQFALLSSSDITNIPTSSITGDVGITPGVRSAISGLTSPEVSGTIYAADDAAPVPTMLIAAKADAESAYLNAVDATRGTPTPAEGNLNGLTLTPGLYSSGSSMEISPGGFLYLDAQGDGNAVFVFKSATSITTESTSEVVLTNSASAENIYWVAGSAITLGTNSKMKGTLIASTSISMLTGARLDGRALIQGAAAGQISLDQNTVVLP